MLQTEIKHETFSGHQPKEAFMITAQDLKGALAIMPTPAKEGADRLDATNTVDLDETARLA